MLEPILVFDSGIGGLSVLTEIRKLLPQHDYHYLFDNARLPYGDLSEQDLVNGCVALIEQQVAKINPSIVVVACNTASTLVLPALRDRLSIPVVGVVPAIKPAATISVKKRIGLLATPGTVKRDYTNELINQFAHDCQVILFGSSELVLMAEEYVAQGEINQTQLANILEPIKQADMDVLVLGCTHFPIIAQQIQQILGDDIKLLDSGSAIANRVKSLIQSTNKSSGHLAVSYTREITAGLYKALTSYGFTSVNHITG
ncbi:glutamate racemase [Shewanella aestuarii]|uniref:Glutamate racemase n=1 Tax=Shewanella aestuarii TaxID=1028752 RepID=A0A6G9QG76_9GAMM|nr:glutamate racemase [Shewanella aestuarii]QIR13173.1 glutamate racemase [Shewanella aestuarii]